MNEPRFEVFPQTRDVPYNDHGKVAYNHEPTGEFVWHFRAADGKITATGGESFTRRESTHRAIDDLQRDMGLAGEKFPPVVDLDEKGDVLR